MSLFTIKISCFCINQRTACFRDKLQTWLMYAYCPDDGPIRLMGHEVRGQRSQRSYIWKYIFLVITAWRTIWGINFKLGSCMHMGVIDTIRFWGHKVKGQRSQRSLFLKDIYFLQFFYSQLDREKKLGAIFLSWQWQRHKFWLHTVKFPSSFKQMLIILNMWVLMDNYICILIVFNPFFFLSLSISLFSHYRKLFLMHEVTQDSWLLE